MNSESASRSYTLLEALVTELKSGLSSFETVAQSPLAMLERQVDSLIARTSDARSATTMDALALSTLKQALLLLQQELVRVRMELQSIQHIRHAMTVPSLSSTPESFESSTTLITAISEE